MKLEGKEIVPPFKQATRRDSLWELNTSLHAVTPIGMVYGYSISGTSRPLYVRGKRLRYPLNSEPDG